MRRFGAGWRAVLLTAGGFGLVAAGCANFVNEVSSREFRVKNLFVDPDPITVLRDSKDGDARAKALRQIKEPRTNGGGDALQAEVMQFVSEAATTDPRPLCRLAAIEALGRFTDPGAAPVLLKAYNSAADFPTDAANPIRCEAMTALGRKDSDDGLTLLAQVASTQRAAVPKSDVRLTGLSSEESFNELLGQFDPDKQAARDSRLAAVRALGVTRNPQAVPVLIPLLDEKDVALRDRAHQALQSITGKMNIAPESDAWRSAMGVAK